MKKLCCCIVLQLAMLFAIAQQSHPDAYLEQVLLQNNPDTLTYFLNDVIKTLNGASKSNKETEGMLWPTNWYTAYLLSSKIGDANKARYYFSKFIQFGFDDTARYLKDRKQYAITIFSEAEEQAFLNKIRENKNHPAKVLLYSDAFEYLNLEPLYRNDSSRVSELYNQLSDWDRYPVLRKDATDLLFYFTDREYNNIPFRVQLPQHYDKRKKYPALLLFHGATGLSSFSKASNTDLDTDFSATALERGYIVIRPIADKNAKFDWQPSPFMELQENPTYKVVFDFVAFLKRYLNIDDDRVFAAGHSDGADAAFCSSLYFPGLFAGYGIFNSMFKQLFADDLFFNNAVFNNYYIVHSTEDQLRRISGAHDAVNQLHALSAKYVYKEYPGLQHYDKHIGAEQAGLFHYFDSLKRNPFPDTICFAFNGIYNKAYWLEATAGSAPSDDGLLVKQLQELKPTGLADLYKKCYTGGNSALIAGIHEKNVYFLMAKNIVSFKLFIAPQMIDSSKPVTVYCNGKLVYEGRVVWNSKFMMDSFIKDFDRTALFINSIKVDLQ